jgi:triphosphoribosyl-dephospho-CoA synthase
VSEPLSIGMCAQAACILDVGVLKPGNVGLMSGFRDMNAIDMLLSAAAIAPVLEQAPLRGVGETILECIGATRRVTDVNTNLGIVLLLAPLATVQPGLDLRGGVMRVLMRLDVADARAAYEAIRLAQPGGLGKVQEQDVAGEPSVGLREAMSLAADRDLVARQYVNDFEQVFEGAEFLRKVIQGDRQSVGAAVIRLFMRMLAKYPDSLIARRHGQPAADEVLARARQIVKTRSQFDFARLVGFDEWLRQKVTPPRNPGTTADLVTASLFVALRQNIIQLPFPAAVDRPPG